MKDTKKWRSTFDLYDKYRLAEYFEEQAQKGWILEPYEGASFLFRRGEPRNLRYCVVYYSKGTIFDVDPTEEQKVFFDFCSQSGWELVVSKGNLQVFSNERENPVPIHTDPQLELENIHGYYKSNQMIKNVLALLAVIQIVLRFFSMTSESWNPKSQSNDLLMILLWGIVLLVYLVESINYYIWYKKAQIVISSGRNLPKAFNNKIRWGIEYLIFASGILAYSYYLFVNASVQAIIFSVILGVLLMFSFVEILKLLRSKRFSDYSSKAKYCMLFGLTSIIAIGVAGAMIVIILVI